jgi:hypothetical protein
MKEKQSTNSESVELEQSFRIRNRCFASENIAYGPAPMGDRPPRCDGPNLNVAWHSRSKFPGTELFSDPSKTSDDLIHSGALRRVFLDHIGDKRLHELEAMISLVRKSQKVF